VSRLATRLRRRIERDGPMPFCAWMEACLYDPRDGYYMRGGRKTGTGPDADFATSPTMHPFLGQAVAREAAALWRRLGRPAGFRILEYGGGEGDLARDALAWLDAHEPGLAEKAAWLHVEASPAHRARQAGPDPRIGQVAGAPAGLVGLVVAHEFLDALPFHWLERRRGAWAAVAVQATDEGFAETTLPAEAGALDAAPQGAFQEGQRVVAMERVRDWVATIAAALGAGAVLVVDYGDEGRRLWLPDRPDGTVRAFRGQRLREDVLADPGGQDITASVDFTLLRQWAAAGGLAEASMESQEAFLVRQGALDALNTAPRASLEDASSYLRLRQMVIGHGGGMGRAFRVARYEKGLEQDA